MPMNMRLRGRVEGEKFAGWGEELTVVSGRPTGQVKVVHLLLVAPLLFLTVLVEQAVP